VHKAQTFGGARAMACSPVPKVGGAAAPSAPPVPTPMMWYELPQKAIRKTIVSFRKRPGTCINAWRTF